MNDIKKINKYLNGLEVNVKKWKETSHLSDDYFEGFKFAIMWVRAFVKTEMKDDSEEKMNLLKDGYGGGYNQAILDMLNFLGIMVEDDEDEEEKSAKATIRFILQRSEDDKTN